MQKSALQAISQNEEPRRHQGRNDQRIDGAVRAQDKGQVHRKQHKVAVREIRADFGWVESGFADSPECLDERIWRH
jgi:hypothetical protein